LVVTHLFPKCMRTEINPDEFLLLFLT
jgi:hypothetical protein